MVVNTPTASANIIVPDIKWFGNVVHVVDAVRSADCLGRFCSTASGVAVRRAQMAPTRALRP